MRMTSALVGILVLAACSNSEPPPVPAEPVVVAAIPAAIPETDLYVLAVGGNGFRPNMDLAALRIRYGADAVVDEDVPLGEGQTERGAIIHPTDATRRAYVYFVDGNVNRTISAIYVRDPGSLWAGPMGLRLGMTTVDLDRLNGKPFRFLGFDWDYGGYVSNWTEGSLATSFLPPGMLAVRLEPPELAEGEQRPEGYPSGDSEFPSDLASVKAQPPIVSEIGLSFVPES